MSLGVRADLSDVPESVGFPVDEPVFCGGQRHDALAIKNYAAYEGYAPEGCTAVTLFMHGDTYDLSLIHLCSATWSRASTRC